MLDEETPPAKELGMEYLHDPYSAYEWLLAEGPQPVIFNGVRIWMVCRYEDVRAALVDPMLSKGQEGTEEVKTRQREEAGLEAYSDERSPGERMLVGHMLNMDGEDHKRLRKLAGNVFTVRRIAALRPNVERIVDNLLDGVAGKPVVDLLAEFAFPLSMTVISEMLGIPERDREKFGSAADNLTVAGGKADLRQVADELASYLATLIAEKRAQPDDALISALIQETDSGDRLDEDELVSMVFQLLVAGYETTAHVIGNGMLTLLNHPDQFAALRADRSLLPGVVEEFLRYDSSLHIATLRYTAEPVEIGGVLIPKGELVTAAIGSANRDPRRYPDPDTFDMKRDAGGHVAFGHGVHHCLGAPLARLEVNVAFAGLMDRFERIELAVPRDELQWQDNLTRGLATLPLRME